MQTARGQERAFCKPIATGLLGEKASQNDAHSIHFTLTFGFKMIFGAQGPFT